MADDATEHDELLQLTSEVITAYVSKNAVPIGELPGLI